MFEGANIKMEKIKKFKNCIIALGFAFLFPLLIFLIVLVSGGMENMKKDKEIGMFTGISWVLFMSAIALREYVGYRRYVHNIQLREMGKYVDARIDLTMGEGKYCFSVRCRRIDFAGEEREYFTSEVYDSRVYQFRIRVGDVVRVYLNPDDPDDYFVDIVGK